MRYCVFSFCTVFLISIYSWGQTTVFSDDFSSDQNASYTTSGIINSSSWTITRSGNDFGGRRNTSFAQLELTNDAGSTTNSNGWIFAHVSTSTFPLPYNRTLSLNPGLVTWTFNMRQSVAGPAGFESGYYGVAFVLAGSDPTANNTGFGYAVVLGQPGEPDPIRLAKYNNGLAGTLTNIITSDTDIGNEYLSIKVIYNPLNNNWELFLRKDGASSFTNPETGTLVFWGEVVDNSYSSVNLDYLGGYWNAGALANQTAFFDNVKITVVNPMPVELISFTGKVLSGKVELNWSTATEVNNFGFEIERAFVETRHGASYSWQNIGFIPGSGNSNSPKEYSFTDYLDHTVIHPYSAEAGYSHSIRYRLKQIDNDGSYSYSEEVLVNDIRPSTFDLRQNFPNPFNPSTIISYQLPESGHVSLKLFDILGNEVAELVNSHREAGYYEYRLSAIDQKLSSGIYYYTLETGKHFAAKKMILIK